MKRLIAPTRVSQIPHPYMPSGTLRLGDVVRFGAWACRVVRLQRDSSWVEITLRHIVFLKYEAMYSEPDPLRGVWRLNHTYPWKPHKRRYLRLNDWAGIEQMSPELILEVAVYEAARKST